MTTKVRAGVSFKNKYWINKHRYYELKHFCLQYNEWKKCYLSDVDLTLPKRIFGEESERNNIENNTDKCKFIKDICASKMKMVEQAAEESDPHLSSYILKAVTENLSFTYLKTKLNMPCGKDMYYDRYRKFFWILSKMIN